MKFVAIVGRPNVGKSTLFNKLVGQRVSIVDDTPGVTRDRIYGKSEWLNREFMLIDTGGIEPDSKDIILSQMREQAQLAIDSADVIIFVTDIKTGMTSSDQEVAQMLQKSGKPIVLCVNKCDSLGGDPPEIYEFYNLGLGDPIAVSSVHGHGTGDLLDAVFDNMPEDSAEETDDNIIKVAIIGKPNAGKSSLVNKIAGEKRMIVSDKAGTTRDAVDTVITRNDQKYLLIDTAGIRRKSKVNDNVEKYSVLRAYMAVDRADVCVIMIDAEEGFTEQDSKIAGYAHEQGKASVIAVNKWDLIDKDGKTMQKFTNKLDYTVQQNARRISTGRLNELLSYATARVQPPSDKGKRLKLYYMTQASVKPPTFVCFCNNKELFHFSYQRYLENQIREAFGLDGTPIRLIPRERGENS